MRAEYIVGIIVVGFVGIGLGTLLLITPVPERAEFGEQASKTPFREIVEPSGFVNTEGITIKGLIGKKVVLVDFMTYSCINCQRTFPYLVAWYENYKNQGLEIVGIHTPEFAFERNIDNVRKALHGFGITYPVVLDNEYATWNAYGNRYWPRKYLIDIYGNIVYDHIGEGAYEKTELKILELLAERAQVLNEEVSMDEGLAASAVPEGVNASRSPETYFGSLRNNNFGNGIPGRPGAEIFTVPNSPTANALYLGGSWNIAPEYAESAKGASVVFRYYAKEVYLVADADSSLEVEVFQDGALVRESRGADVSATGKVSVKESRLYKLIKNPEPGEHTLELRVQGAGLRLYAFTFG